VNVDGGQGQQLGQRLHCKIKAPALITPQGLETELMQPQAKAKEGEEKHPVAGPNVELLITGLRSLTHLNGNIG
jgi:hypothetical protein